MSVLIKDHSLDYIPKLENLQKIETLETSTPATEKIQESLHYSQADFSRWRPTFHLLAPHGWLNDPCGPGYDPSTGKYHLAFQWNPNGNDWGDISWGYSESKDLVNWETSSKPCLSPSAWYDCKGIFTGCFHPSSTSGQQDGTLTYIYTSVNHLPIHYTLPYVKGCESLSFAESHDGGATWNRKPCNPILPGPPKDLPVTGWRDPFICPSWPSALAHLPRTRDGEEVLCGLIAGGLVNHTPTVFVYTVKKNDLTDWKYAGILADTGLNFRPSRWSGDFGMNWEVANLVTLKDDEGTSRDFVIMGTEGCLPGEEHYLSGHDSIARQKRTQRSQLWMCMKSNETSPSSPALAQYSFAGIFDNGLYYAANSFWDPVSNQQVVFGWITEEDLPDGPRHRQGWSGLISLPRVLKLQTMHRVKRARSTTEMGKITSVETIPDDRGTFTIRTLGIAPDKRLEKLRHNAHQSSIADRKLEPLSGLGADRNNSQFLPLTTLQWEVEAEIQVGKNCSRAGFAICDGSDKTILYWDPISENFIVDRPNPRINHSKDSDAGINHGPEISPHTLFTRVVDSRENDNSPEAAATEIEETLKIRAIFDVSVLEVFVNERTAISTRIYRSNNPDTQTSDEPGRFGIYFFADRAVHDKADGNTEDDSAARLVHAAVWDGISAH